jgi:hypothetical protein
MGRRHGSEVGSGANAVRLRELRARRLPSPGTGASLAAHAPRSIVERRATPLYGAPACSAHARE